MRKSGGKTTFSDGPAEPAAGPGGAHSRKRPDLSEGTLSAELSGSQKENSQYSPSTERTLISQ